MWTCVNCGESVEDNFTQCWNCLTDKDGLLPEGDHSIHETLAAENRAIAPERPGSIDCLRCGNTLEYTGTMRFSHSPAWVTGEIRFIEVHRDLEMYVCGRCGHVEFLAPNFVG
jgi:hypothetical protein